MQAEWTTFTPRWLGPALLTTLFALALAACGGRAVPTAAGSAPASSALSSGWLGSLPAPNELVHRPQDSAAGAAARQTAAVPVLRRNGADTDPALAPQHAAPAGHRLQLAPHWTSAAAAPGNLAWALYRLNLSGYSGPSVLTLHWLHLGATPDCVIGVADFQHDRWRILAGADGALPIPDATFQAARDPASGDMLVLVALAGQDAWELSSLEAGLPARQISGVTPTTGWTGQLLTMAATVSGQVDPAAEWNWDLNDGQPDHPGQAGSITYQLGSLGAYECRVEASDADGDVECPFVLEVTALPRPHITGVQHYQSPPPPGAPSKQGSAVGGGAQGDFEALEVVNSGGSITTWAWDFGGACAPGTSTTAHPFVVWGAPGIYQASVTGSNAAGSDTYQFVLTVGPPRVPAPNSVEAESGDSLHSCFAGVPATLYWQNGGGPADSFLWTFDAALSPASSVVQYPQVTAAAPGAYACSLDATNSSGSGHCDFTLNVLPLDAPQISQVQSPQPAVAGQSYAFYAAIGNGMPVTSWSWDFGGGCNPDTADSYSPSGIQALAPGTYSCSVTATNPAGADTYNFTLTVQ